MPTVTTQVQITASPEIVRAKFLSFSQIPQYSSDGFVRSIASAKGKQPIDLEKDDVLNVVVGYGGYKFSPVVLENSPSAFRWRGSLPGIFTGDHGFHFREVIVEGRTETLLLHEEVFSGALAFLMGEGMLANWAGQNTKTRGGFEDFNRRFKAWVESS